MARKRTMKANTTHIDKTLKEVLDSVRSQMLNFELVINKDTVIPLEEKECMLSKLKKLKTQITKVINGELEYDIWEAEFNILFSDLQSYINEVMNNGRKFIDKKDV